MSEEKSKLPSRSYPGIGLVFGCGIGIVFGQAIVGDVSLGLVLGSSFGLMIGAVLYTRSKNQTDNDNSEE